MLPSTIAEIIFLQTLPYQTKPVERRKNLKYFKLLAIVEERNEWKGGSELRVTGGDGRASSAHNMLIL